MNVCVDLSSIEGAELIDPSAFMFTSAGMSVEGPQKSAGFARAFGSKVENAAADAGASWAGLPAGYQAPEQERVYVLMDPVVQGGAMVNTAMTSAAAALDLFAEELILLKIRLVDLEGRAGAFRASVLGTFWQEDPSSVRMNDALHAEYSRLMTQFITSAQDCENSLAKLIPAADAGQVGQGGPAVPYTPPALTDPGLSQLTMGIWDFLGLWPENPDPVAIGGSAYGWGELAFGYSIEVMIRQRYGVYLPQRLAGFGWRGWGSLNQGALPVGLLFDKPGSRRLPPAQWSRLTRLGHDLLPGSLTRDWSWKNPESRANFNRWSTAAKWLGRAGGVVTAATSGWQQWQDDSTDPTLDTADRVDRAATTAAATGLGAVAGAKGGALIGAALGTFIAPGPGTAIGAVAGGLIGGAVGAWGGSEVADLVNEQHDGAVQAVRDGWDRLTDWFE